MASDDSYDDIEGDKGDNNPADDKAGFPESALQTLMFPLLSLSLKVHQVVRIVRLILLKFCSCVLGKTSFVIGNYKVLLLINRALTCSIMNLT